MIQLHSNRSPGRQRGLALTITAIMLVLITLIVLVAFNLGKNNLAIVGNAQNRNEAVTSAQQTIEAAISSPLLTTNPKNIFPTPCTKDANTQCYDVNGDGKNDVTVTLTPAPSCVKAQTIKLSSLNLALENDRRCTVEVVQGGFGVGGTATDDSLCSNSLWDIRAEAKDANTKATAVVNQGIAVRVRTADIATACPEPTP